MGKGIALRASPSGSARGFILVDIAAWKSNLEPLKLVLTLSMCSWADLARTWTNVFTLLNLLLFIKLAYAQTSSEFKYP